MRHEPLRHLVSRRDHPHTFGLEPQFVRRSNYTQHWRLTSGQVFRETAGECGQPMLARFGFWRQIERQIQKRDDHYGAICTPPRLPISICFEITCLCVRVFVPRENGNVGITGHLPRHLQPAGNLHRAASISRAKATWQTVSAGPKEKVDSLHCSTVD